MKKLYIRVDGNRILGLGHIMRCMSIADAYVESGGQCEFISADKDVLTIVAEKGYRANIIIGQWNNLQYEINIMLDFIKSHNVELLLVDSYYVNEEYFQTLHKYTTIGYLTGKCDKCYDIDALINYTIGSERLNYKSIYADTKTKIFTGVKYTPLRKQFDVTPCFSNIVENILVTTGGTDAGGISLKLLEEIQKRVPDLLKCNWHIVIGKFYSLEIKNKLKSYSYKNRNIILYENVKDMAELMKKCDIAVSATGTTIYELCACGVPSIAFAFVDNQINGLYEFSKEGLVFSAGDIREDMHRSICMIMDYIIDLKKDKLLRKMQSKKMKNFIDGRGAWRLAEVLQTL